MKPKSVEMMEKMLTGNYMKVRGCKEDIADFWEAVKNKNFAAAIRRAETIMAYSNALPERKPLFFAMCKRDLELCA